MTPPPASSRRSTVIRGGKILVRQPIDDDTIPETVTVAVILMKKDTLVGFWIKKVFMENPLHILVLRLENPYFDIALQILSLNVHYYFQLNISCQFDLNFQAHSPQNTSFSLGYQSLLTWGMV